MPIGKTVFSQLMDLVSENGIDRYNGDFHALKSFEYIDNFKLEPENDGQGRLF